MVKGGWGEFRGGSGGWGGGLGASDRHEESCGEPDKPPPTSPTSPDLPQPCRSHLNTIHSTPMVAARTIDRTTLRRRRPAGHPDAVSFGASHGTAAGPAGHGE